MRKRLTDNNLRILREIAAFRLMTTAQIHRRTFNCATAEAAANVLRRLHREGFVSRAWGPVVTSSTIAHARPPAVWYLTPANLKAVRLELGATERADLADDFMAAAGHVKHTEAFAANTIRHELAITEFYLALSAATTEEGVALPFWLRTSPRHPDISMSVAATITNRQTMAFEERVVPFNPDAVHALRSKQGYSFYFLEMDMNTETGKEKISNKFIAYLAYFNQERFRRILAPRLIEQFRLPIAEPDRASFRVLFVATTEKRRNDLLLRATRFPTQRLFHFATLEAVTRNPLGPIWLSKADWDPSQGEYQREAARLNATRSNEGALREWAQVRINSLLPHALL